jgi:hypothetical protein
MRYVVKDKSTGEFLQPSGKWTSRLNQAERFPNSLSLSLHLEKSGAVRDRGELEILQLPIG